MAYLGSLDIDDLLTFTCNTHRFDSGVASDADALPAYRVYEDETAAAILTGTMALLDDPNTVGFYSEQITLSAANGFEIGKCYTVYISATVNGVSATMHHQFRVSPITIFPAGAIEYTYTVTNSVTLLPEEGVDVWVSTDLAGTNVVWRGTTDSFGVARDVLNSKPMLDAGTYYFWRNKVGFTDVDPDIEVVS